MTAAESKRKWNLSYLHEGKVSAFRSEGTMMHLSKGEIAGCYAGTRIQKRFLYGLSYWPSRCCTALLCLFLLYSKSLYKLCMPLNVLTERKNARSPAKFFCRNSPTNRIPQIKNKGIRQPDSLSLAAFSMPYASLTSCTIETPLDLKVTVVSSAIASYSSLYWVFFKALSALNCHFTSPSPEKYRI